MACDAPAVTLPRPRSAPAADPWLRRLRPGPAQSVAGAARVVCFPHAGGGAGTYRPLATAVAARSVGDRPHEVLAVQYPGRNDRIREARVEDLRTLAAGAHRALTALPDGPLVLLGHSMGALVAYEVARLLERDGRAPAHLVVSSAWAPTRVPGGTVHLRDDAGLIDEIRHTRGTDQRLLDNRDVLAMALPVVRSDYKAVETYRHRPGPPLATPVTVLTGDRDPLVGVADAAAWQARTRAGFRLRVFPGGDHFYLTGHWAELADHLVSAPPRPVPVAVG
ncbi:alpha/beta fold hydrolase [Streptomyces albulus]|uniref:thioesterase II family protein n=1 Tax=Streptomyces noursei TaxID=1971 RepID=UPI001F46E7C6|nr:alpha/beta fold hydrolase [Streptomyces noursei]MCE4948782.1 alpha/beta fold hydrolase [Streptomyces noursei]